MLGRKVKVVLAFMVQTSLPGSGRSRENRRETQLAVPDLRECLAMEGCPPSHNQTGQPERGGKEKLTTVTD